MKKIIYLLIVLFSVLSTTNAQILGGGTNFSNAIVFNNAWLTSCPSGAQTLSNVVTFEPTIPIDACAPIPSIACVPAGSTSASDVWFSFYATKSTAKIVVAPTSAFNIVLQAFSGSACPGLTDIGCANLLGNNGSETLNLTGLTVNQLYYFRIFGIGNNAGVRTGQYTFCGTTDLGSSVLPLFFSDFSVKEKDGKPSLNWTTNAEINNDYFEIEKSEDGNRFLSIGKVKKLNANSQSSTYHFIDENAISSIAFYRIKQVDIDGKFTYSAIVNFKRKTRDNNSIYIYPNPIQDKINVTLKANSTATSLLKIVNEFGQVMYTQNIKVINGQNEITINKPANLTKGIYTLQIITAFENYNSRFICL
jgi:Secretion system C-terminal sorting domain